ncbi:MAG: hypothetical protein JW969_19415, partial [Spirochaetales bacterium]|nr:hypothetical protein [Spirochaetales bacterium]
MQAENSNIGANISILGLLNMPLDLRDVNNKWEYMELYGKTGEDQTNLPVVARLGYYGNLSKGIALFDDLSLVEITNVPDSKIIDFSSGSFLNEKQGFSEIYSVLLIAGIVLFIIFMFLLVLFSKKIKFVKKIINLIKERIITRKYGKDRRKHERRRRK